jgi:hypothetical protein
LSISGEEKARKNKGWPSISGIASLYRSTADNAVNDFLFTAEHAESAEKNCKVQYVISAFSATSAVNFTFYEAVNL